MAAYAQPAPTPVPAPQASPATLPEIGRIRAVTPFCAAMRDVFIPSVKIAQNVDARFEQKAAPELPSYIEAVDEDPDNPLRALKITYLDQQVTNMKEALLKIESALDDRRLRNARDAQTMRLRDRLQDLYDAESGRANILWEFVQRERVKMARHELESALAKDHPLGQATPTPDPRITPTPYAMPSLTGIPIQDRKTMAAWAHSLTVAVGDVESPVATVINLVASGCS